MSRPFSARTLANTYALTLLALVISCWVVFAVVQSTLTTKKVPKPVWIWRCFEGKCVKIRPEHKNDLIISLTECRVSCSQYAALWPYPTGRFYIGDRFTQVNTSGILVKGIKSNSPISKLMFGAVERFLNIAQKNIVYHGKRLEIILNVELDTNKLGLQTKESYELDLKELEDRVEVTIKAETFFGARHGLETLSQLVIYDDLNHNILVPTQLSIIDEPKYPYRGLMLDTARHYISIEGIKNTIEGMAMSKLNTFHWHISDSQSFPYVSKSQPTLSLFGAYSQKQIYTSEQISEIVEFATPRGVRVIPEIDVPGHVGEGWKESGILLSCRECKNPPCGQLDPTKPNLYDILEGLFKDIIDDFDPEIFHMGGDEISVGCWIEKDHIAEWMLKRRWPYHHDSGMKLWGLFQKEAAKKLLKHAKNEMPIIVWSSMLTTKHYIDENLSKERYVIQVWADTNEIDSFLDLGYKLILSNVNAFYLDCGFGNSCPFYNSWERIYDQTPSVITGGRASLVLGAEVTAWTERIDESYMDSRIWPRAAALAESLWSDTSSRTPAVKQRFLVHRERIVDAGIKAEAIESQWCIENYGSCDNFN